MFIWWLKTFYEKLLAWHQPLYDAKLLKGHLVEGDGPANSIKKEKFGGMFKSVPYWLH